MASTNLDTTAAQAALKELYDGQKVESLVYMDNPFLALVPKKTDFFGKYYPCPVQSGISQGRSTVFATAQTNQSAAEMDAFQVVRKSDYSIARISRELMLAAESNKGSFIDEATLLVDDAVQSLTNSICASLFRSSTGSIGRIGSISSGVITLSSAAEVVNFERNMVLQCTDGTTDGNTPRAALGYVIAVNRTAGTVTVASDSFNGSAATPTSWTTDEYLLVEGDSNNKFPGLASWIPTSAPGATAFLGVNRARDTTRLGGLRYDGSSQSIEEALIDGTALGAREGARFDHCFTSYASYAALEKGLMGKVQYVDLSGPAGIGFRGIKVAGANGPMTVLCDRSCPPQLAYALQMNTWELKSLGDAPHIQEENGKMITVYNQDSAEVRVSFYGSLLCRAPGKNMVIQLGA